MSRRFWLAATLLIAAALRLWSLEGMPPGFYHDEAYNALDALALVEGREFPVFHEAWELYADEAHADRPPVPTRFPLFFEGNYGREPLHVYLMALSIWLFGATPFAVRLVPALAGVLAVWTTFLAARALWQREPEDSAEKTLIPLVAAITLATLFPAVHFSRFGLRMMLFVPLATCAVAAFWRGIHTPRPRATLLWWSLAGALIGAGLYVYAAARLFPLVFAGFLLAWGWRDRAVLRRYGAAFAALTGAALLVALPLLLWFARYPYFFVFRMAYVANRGAGTVEGQAWLTWLLNIGRTVRGLYWQGETHLRHNLPGRPYLDAVQAALFTLGLGAGVLSQRHRRQYLFLALWLGVMLLPTILSGDAPHFGRMTGAAPALAIWVGVGVAALWRGLAAQWPARRALFAALLPALLLLVSTGWTARDYFRVYGQMPALATGVWPVADGFYRPDWELGQLLAAESAETIAYLAPPQQEMATLFFALAGHPDRLRSYEGSAGLIPAGIPGQPALYAVRPGWQRTLENLRAFYGAAWQETHTPEVVIGRVAAEVPRNPLPPLPDGGWSFGGMVRLLALSAETGAEGVVVTLVWENIGRIATPHTAFVHLLDRDGEIVAQLDRPPAGYPVTDWRPGEVIVERFVIAPPPQDGAWVALRTGFYDSATLTPLGEPFVR